MAAYPQQKSAPGIDNIDIQMFETDIEDQLHQLLSLNR
jgi:hypothetical protein